MMSLIFCNNLNYLLVSTLKILFPIDLRHISRDMFPSSMDATLKGNFFNEPLFYLIEILAKRVQTDALGDKGLYTSFP